MSPRTLVLLLAIVLTVPMGAAKWSGKGSSEPDTPEDVNGGFMYANPPDVSPTALGQVYFNGFLTDGDTGTAVSPNSGIVQSAILPPRSSAWVMFGVWKDCNSDGFIGSADAQYIYRAEDPSVNTAVCPVDHVFPTHNDGSWIYEMIPISWKNASGLACCDANTYVDNGAKVWADAGLETDVVQPRCGLSQQPPGTFHSTGGLLAWTDCEDAYQVTHAVNGVGPLSFADKPDGEQGRSSSPANVRFAFGESKDPSFVGVWDCSGGAPSTTVHDPTNGKSVNEIIAPSQQTAPEPFGGMTTSQFGVPGVVIFRVVDSDDNLANVSQNSNVSPRGPNTGGSVAGTLNQTDQGTDCNPHRSTNGDAVYCPVGFYACETAAFTSPNGRVRPDATFVSQQWPHTYMDTNHTDIATDVEDKSTGEQEGLDVRQYWFSPEERDEPPALTRDGHPAPASHWSFYGYVSPNVLVANGLSIRAGSDLGIYGQHACDATALDGRPRFDCDATHWWRNPDGTERSPRQAGANNCDVQNTNCDPRVFVGDPYNLLDVDCYDASVAAARGVGASPSAILAGKGC